MRVRGSTFPHLEPSCSLDPHIYCCADPWLGRLKMNATAGVRARAILSGPMMHSEKYMRRSILSKFKFPGLTSIYALETKCARSSNINEHRSYETAIKSDRVHRRRTRSWTSPVLVQLGHFNGLWSLDRKPSAADAKPALVHPWSFAFVNSLYGPCISEAFVVIGRQNSGKVRGMSPKIHM